MHLVHFCKTSANELIIVDVPVSANIRTDFKKNPVDSRGDNFPSEQRGVRSDWDASGLTVLAELNGSV